MCSADKRDAVQRGALKETERAGFEPAVEVIPLRRFSKPVPDSTSGDSEDTCDADKSTPTYNRTNSTGIGTDLQKIADAVAALPEADRQTVVEHIQTLARLSPARRAAILTLADPDA